MRPLPINQLFLFLFSTIRALLTPIMSPRTLQPLSFVIPGPILPSHPYFNSPYMFLKLLANLPLFSPGMVATNVNCSDQLTAEIVIWQQPSSRFLSHFRMYVSQGKPNITCSDMNFANKIGTGLMIPWALTGMDSATFAKSD